jgi:hypothetical protein
MTMTGDCSSLENKEVDCFNVDVLSAKIAVFYLSDQDKGLILLKRTTDKTNSEIVAYVDGLIKNIPESFILKALEDYKDAEVFDGITLENITSNTPVASSDWYHRYAWFPVPFGVIVNGFNATFNNILIQNGLAKIKFKSEYDWNNTVIGTKWGIYDIVINGDEIAFNTAWSPLSESAMLHLAQHVKNLTGFNTTSIIFAEQGSGFSGIAVIEYNKEHGFSREEYVVNDLYISYVEGDDEDGEGDYEIDDSSIPEYLKPIIPYGFGG